jgi:hypothetical protein
MCSAELVRDLHDSYTWRTQLSAEWVCEGVMCNKTLATRKYLELSGLIGQSGLCCACVFPLSGIALLILLFFINCSSPKVCSKIKWNQYI